MTTREKAPTILTAAGARKLTARIRDALALADDLLVRAYEGRAWEALGHASWPAYCAQELPQLRMLRLSKVAQTEHFTELAKQGLSTHATAAAYGVSQGTVRNRLKGVDLPDTVMSRDGRRRPSRAPERPTPPVAARVSNVDRAVAEVARSGAAGLTYIELCARLKWRGGQATGALSEAYRRGLVVSSGTFRDGCNAFTIGSV